MPREAAESSVGVDVQGMRYISGPSRCRTGFSYHLIEGHIYD
jgi:hypothetical protein